MRVLTLTGSPRERGRQHGEECRDDIQKMLGGWEYAIGKSTGRSLTEWCVDFRENTRFDEAKDQWCHGLNDEIRGMADGAAVDPEHLYLFNCTDENQWFMEHRASGLDLPEGRGCSSLGASHLIAQNMDIPGATDGYQVLMHIKHENSDLEVFLFSMTGMLGMIGLNSKGVGVVNNSLRQLAVRPDGVPVNAMVRGILDQTTFGAACDFIQTAPHATGHNYIVGGPGGARMFECSARGTTELPNAGTMVHTNHPLASTDLNDHEAFRGARSTSNTEVRLATLNDALAEDSHLTVERAKALLSSHADIANPVCRHVTDRKTNFTAAAVVYELTDSPTLHIAPGPPCEVPFETYRF